MRKEKLTFLILGSGVAAAQLLPRVEAACPAKGSCSLGCGALALPLLSFAALLRSRAQRDDS